MTDANPLLVNQQQKFTEVAAKHAVNPPDMQQVSDKVQQQRSAEPPKNPLISDNPMPRKPAAPIAPAAPAVTEPPPPEPAKTETKPVTPVAPAASETTEPSFEPDIPEDLNKPKEPVDPVDALLEAPDDDKSVAVSQNFKLLKGSLKQTKEVVKQKELELQETQKKLKAYESGELTPEVHVQRENRIKELETYEHIHNLKSSPGYKKEITDPLDTAINQLTEFAESYDVDQETIDKALDLDEEADLNKFVSSKFDNLGAVKFKELITSIQNLETKARLFEADSKGALEKLNAKHQEAVQLESAQRKVKIAETGRQVWSQTVEKMRTEGTAASLLVKNGDPKYISEYVTPMLQKAAKEYGRILRVLAESGLQELSPEAAEALCTMTVLAHDSAIATKVSEAALKELEETEEARNRLNPLLRPAVGSRGTGMPPVQKQTSPTAGKTTRELGRELITSVLNK